MLAVEPLKASSRSLPVPNDFPSWRRPSCETDPARRDKIKGENIDEQVICFQQSRAGTFR
ncbi:hypothetical protein AA0242T_0087 [Acetobacter aceti NRIC 0242]|uniref:Uncharacterized protein n=1 Tax=Acetobacter aceti NBRC 14818 TaxID=887700 RepID=A0AB33IA99_ACEAC|nr:hypothetical protein EMQ_0702 [Acetobacter aceti NBRC 14818]GAN57049.1 hypothetical protein Abac_013_011 [Acetobacter aceti NBRC 14818]GBO79385.1 hypothetical protein AA0242T_0087 [Acetobacter aceti NRIC 0242]